MPVLHETYLPVEEAELRRHFVRDPADQGDPERHLEYYRASLRRAGKLDSRKNPTPSETKKGRQFEKDERFWVAAALLALYRDEGRRADRFDSLLRRAGVQPPGGYNTWAESLAGDLKLYFEVSLPRPEKYRDYLEKNIGQRMPIPHLRELASKSGRYEGATRLDAALLAPENGVAVFFEAKVLSDVSTKVEYDTTRNQLARIIDVSLETASPDRKGRLHPDLTSRNPDLTAVVLLTPKSLSPRSSTPGASRNRLYGFLMPEYRDRDSGLLAQHLPHRTPDELAGVPDRLGWATWEDCNEVLPGACPWLE